MVTQYQISGDVIPKIRQHEKEGFVIYGSNGSRPAIHTESKCNFSNSNFECGAGYYHGYLTYKGVKIMDDDVLNNEVAVTSIQTGFDLDYLVEFSAVSKSVALHLKEQPKNTTDSTTKISHWMSSI